MDKSSKIIIVGSGIFGLSLAYQLATEGYRNITILDRNMPPVPDGSSVDISRVIRFDYGDDIYTLVAHEAYKLWSEMPKYNGIFNPTPIIGLATPNSSGQRWIRRVTASLKKHNLPFEMLENAAATKKRYPTLTGNLTNSKFLGYHHMNAGWADATKAVTQLRDECLKLGISFISGPAGTVVSFESNSSRDIKAVRTLAGTTFEGEHFVLAAGAWSSSLVSMYGSALATAQAIAYVNLSPAEMEKYKDLPITLNSSSGWFNFPPHEDTQTLKFAIHGWGYTRTPTKDEKSAVKSDISAPPLRPYMERPNFIPADAESRLRQGLRTVLPELADRLFDKVALCWYTDTPSGDFIMDFHPDYNNLFVAGGGSGHAFKFLPVLSKYTSLAIKKQLPPELAEKWRFHKEYQNNEKAFQGDGSRGGPQRRELQTQERAKI